MTDATQCYGTIAYYNSNLPVALVTQDTYVKVASTETQPLVPYEVLGLTPLVTTGNGQFTVPTFGAGLYAFNTFMDYVTSTVNRYMMGALFINGSPFIHGLTERDIRTVATLPTSRSGEVRLAAGDVVDYRVKCTNASSETITVKQFAIALRRIAQ